MQAYKFDSNGYFSGTVVVQKDPMGDGYLLPDRSTLIEPVFQAGKKCKWVGQEWGYEDIDYAKIEQEKKQKEAVEFSDYYTSNPTLAVRVRQYKNILTNYSLEPTASSEQISAAILSDTTKTESEKTILAANLLSLIHDIEINLNEVSPGNGLSAWSLLPKLIEYLPVEA